MQNSQAVQKMVQPSGEKVVGGHEMAAMIWMIIMALCVCINKIYYLQHNCNIAYL